MQITSLEAYDKVKFSNWCTYEKLMILKMLDEKPMCGRDMASALNVEAYALRPRITQLKKAGKIQDSGEKKSFEYMDRNGRMQIAREIIWELTPNIFQSGYLC